ncbi:unnamed protein product [Withania somnifera]
MGISISDRSSVSNISFPSIVQKTFSSKSTKMGFLSTNNISCNVTSSTSTMVAQRKLPILLFDVMDTVVKDPFYHDVPAFFRMSMKELLESKHPTAWIEFAKGLITEDELTRKFFKDGRSFDMECVEGLMKSLKENGYEIHAFTNYPIWYQMIEDELKLSNYLSWTFCSCKFGKWKPEPDFYLEVVKHLNTHASNCIFVDISCNELGLKGLQFKNVDLLRKDLSLLGVHISTNENQDLI